MTAAVALLVYAVVLAFFGTWPLRRLTWTERAPRLGVIVWQAATASALGALVLAGVVLTASTTRASHGLAQLLDACQAILQAHYGGVKQPVGAYAGMVVAIGVTGWILVRVAVSLLLTARRRRGHLRALAVVAWPRPDLQALVLEHRQPMAYCLPGRHRCVVLTTGALDCLDEGQLAAVLAHERAHLRGRHDLAVTVAAAIERAFPGVPLFRAAHQEIAHLVELVADDAAARRHDRATVAAALVTLAAGRAPAGALGASGSLALHRVRRLLAPHRPLSRPARLGGGLGVVLLMILPIVLAANPAIIVFLQRHCHLPT
ncbi:M56 family metallopeptidase [Actinomadura sp. NPDC047616]|uniref:M56 family metallopeptidase n=1 Tax=Actinomadura sp. NPDC047616 TaxID=3155914 RepID=UPI0033E21415